MFKNMYTVKYKTSNLRWLYFSSIFSSFFIQSVLCWRFLLSPGKGKQDVSPFASLWRISYTCFGWISTFILLLPILGSTCISHHLAGAYVIWIAVSRFGVSKSCQRQLQVERGKGRNNTQNTLFCLNWECEGGWPTISQILSYQLSPMPLA